MMHTVRTEKHRAGVNIEAKRTIVSQYKQEIFQHDIDQTNLWLVTGNANTSSGKAFLSVAK